ncbi:Putative Homoisocitrate dehydrogenase [Rhizopus microsporus]|nr:Putative Homoisocitrate dehydrogenase [Rhizopus microsporus]
MWHRLSPASKQLVDDLKILRQLLGYLTAYDCVTFYSFMETVIAANAPNDIRQTRQSQWLFTDAGNRAVAEARKRVYLKKGDPKYDETPASAEDPELPSHIKLVLEEQPKWNLLNSILREIEHSSLGLNHGEGAAVLIMVSERRTCRQLQEYITRLNDQVPSFLKSLAHRFFKWRSTIHQMQVAASTRQNTTPQSTNITRGRPPPNKRRRVRGGSTAAAGPGREGTSLADTFSNDVIQVASILDDEEEKEEIEEEEGGANQVNFRIDDTSDDILPTFEEIPKNSIITIQSYDDDLHEQILEDTQPRFIIMFDPNPAFVRQVEVYRAKHPTIDVRVYFMLYENSVEEQNYLSLIKKEKESFEKLIHEKSVMAIPLPEKRKEREIEVIRPSTRIAGGQVKVATGPKVIIVDMREFRNVLPPILYARGIKIEPCTLQVGDFVLSPDICVERKSISDLIQSLNSGRLYTQCEIIPAARRVLESLNSGPKFEFVNLDAGFELFQKTGTSLPQETIEVLKNECQGALFGAVSSPSHKVAGYSSPIVALRKHLDLYANVRPVKSVNSPAFPNQKLLDMLIIRENTECLYIKSEREEVDPNTGLRVAYADRKITEFASQRAGKMAFNMALTRQQLREQIPIEKRFWKVSNLLFFGYVSKGVC